MYVLCCYDGSLRRSRLRTHRCGWWNEERMVGCAVRASLIASRVCLCMQHCRAYMLPCRWPLRAVAACFFVSPAAGQPSSGCRCLYGLCLVCVACLHQQKHYDFPFYSVRNAEEYARARHCCCYCCCSTPCRACAYRVSVWIVATRLHPRGGGWTRQSEIELFYIDVVAVAAGKERLTFGWLPLRSMHCIYEEWSINMNEWFGYCFSLHLVYLCSWYFGNDWWSRELTIRSINSLKYIDFMQFCS